RRGRRAGSASASTERQHVEAALALPGWARVVVIGPWRRDRALTPSLPSLRNARAQPRAGAYPGPPQLRDGSFHSRFTSTVSVPVDGRGTLDRDFALKGRSGRPRGPVPLAEPSLPDEAATCAVTWLGHATVLLKVEGHWLLTD